MMTAARKLPAGEDGPAVNEAAAAVRLDALLEKACSRIAPTWPLDRFIAVNPLWGWIDSPFPRAAARLAAQSGATMLMPRSWYRERFEAGEFDRSDVEAALAQCGSAAGVDEILRSLARDGAPVARRLRVMDVADLARDPHHEMGWREFVVHSTSQWCASWFDEGQAALPPDHGHGLYSSWLQQARIDRSPAILMGLRSWKTLAAALPEDPHETISAALADLDVAPEEVEGYLAALLLDVGGWAAWCAYRRWTARLAGSDDDDILELLAIRIAWEWTLLRNGGPALAQRWQAEMSTWPSRDRRAEEARQDDWVLQRAMEAAWQRKACEAIAGACAHGEEDETDFAQVAFCIDVRSEVFRRALESSDSGVRTRGFAGFFGLPVDYLPLGAAAARPQLPGLLAPKLRISDQASDEGLPSRRRGRLDLQAAWKSVRTGAVSAFPFVEALGPFYGAKLLDEAFGSGGSGVPDGLREEERQSLRPRLASTVDGEELSVDARADLAAGILRAMGLVRFPARLVALVGHGSASRNNAHAAGLDCGACCGQTGEVNARAAAALLNDGDVRAALALRGIEVPARTRFVAALHNTTTDEVTIFDRDEAPASHAADLARLRRSLEAAGRLARRERAPLLGLDAGASDEELLEAVRERTNDWAQVRPEWGLAGNAAFVIAPRSRTRPAKFDGRVFLHDYRHEDDADGSVLELLMTAPMVVTHWINMQYWASTVDNLHYGSGDKVLHNVVGGHLGVFEGNGGDLRIGLSMQSLHDGKRWMHAPLRLSVFIEAPREAIERVIAKHETVRRLVDNEWLHLFQLDGRDGSIHARRGGKWCLAGAESRARAERSGGHADPRQPALRAGRS